MWNMTNDSVKIKTHVPTLWFEIVSIIDTLIYKKSRKAA